jgi:proline dehydrogenase
MFSVSKAVFQALAASKGMKAMASRYGMRDEGGFARRFVAGESVAEAIGAARRIQASRMTTTLDYLGESTATMAEADAATRAYIAILQQIAASDIDRNVSLKLTQLGLHVDRATCVDNLRRILDPASAQDFFVRLDMEDSRYTQVTLDIFETLWQQGYHQAGVVLQSYLPRSLEDARRMNALGARVRLVKGAYKEPRGVAYRSKAQVDAAFVSIMALLFERGKYPAVATHDPAMIAEAKRLAAAHRLAADAFEFQMLYGVRRDMQDALTAEGYRVRVYIPFGHQWFPYFMRRLGERPANLTFVLGSLLKERSAGRR